MSDAPRWPGADGSTGLDFSRSDRPQTQPAAAASDDDTRPVPKATESSDRPAFAFDAPPAKTPSASKTDDWGLDSITRTKSPSLDSTIENITVPARSSSASSGPTPARASRLDDTSTGASVTSSPARLARRTRKARLRLSRIDPWSVMKTSFLFSIAFGVMLVAAVAVLWSVFVGSDTMTYINDFVNRIMADDELGGAFDIANYLGWERVLGLTAVLAAIDVVIFTAVATLFAFLYNLSAVIMGGLEVTLAED